MKKVSIGLLLIVSVFLFFSLAQPQEKPMSSGELYDAAMAFFNKGKYPEAIERFSKLIQTFPQSKLVSYAHYMMGQSFLKMERYEEAIEKFEYYLRAYPGGDRVRESEQGLKMARERLGTKRRTRETVVELKPRPAETKKEDTPSIALSEAKTLPAKSQPGIVPEGKKVKRRICAQISYLDGKNFTEVEKRIKELREAGVDTLLFRVFQNRGDRMYRFVKARYDEGVFFKTEHAQVIDDILGKIVEIAHRQGVEIFAWMTTRYATYGIDQSSSYRARVYNFETKKMEIGRGYNLFHPDVLKRLEGLFRDLGRYPIDGILFQDDLILRHNEDFSPEANRAFLKEFGYSPHPDIFYVEPYKSDSGKYYVKGYTERFWTWAKWKNAHLMEVAGRLMAAARESNPTLQVAINLYFEAVLNDSNGMAWFSQALPEALEKGFDYYAVMAYHRQAMKGRNIGLAEAMDLMVDVAKKALKTVGDPYRVMMKIWILDWKTNEAVGFDLAPQREIEEILDKILQQGEVSLAFVPYTHQFPLYQLKGRWSVTK